MNRITRVLGLAVSSVLIYLAVVSGATATAAEYPVSAGQSGAWYDPSHDGEGFVLQVLDADSALIYWFTYDTEGNQRWMIGVGDIAGSRITFDELLTSSGGKFGPDFDPRDVVISTWGTLELEFVDCDRATATYAGPAAFGSGSLDLQRLSRIWGQQCDGSNSGAQQSFRAGRLSPGFTGSWYDPSHDGEGFTVEILDEEKALVYWFTYDEQGNQVWVVDVAMVYTNIIAASFLVTSGGKFGPNFDPDDIVAEYWGSATFTFGSCGSSPDSAGYMNYHSEAESNPQVLQLSLYRLTSINGLDCVLWGRRVPASQ